MAVYRVSAEETIIARGTKAEVEEMFPGTKGRRCKSGSLCKSKTGLHRPHQG